MRRIGPVWMWLLLFCCGCVSYPMGLNQQQWNSLSPAQQAELQAKQYQVDEGRRQQADAIRLQREQQAMEATRLEKERVNTLYANARYGDIVTVTVQGGYLTYASKRYPYESTAFDIIKGESKKVFFRGRGMQTVATDYVVRLSDDGNTLFFDDESRQRAVLVNHDWEHGETYQPAGTMNDVSVALSGMTFFVKLKGLPGAPPKMIIENR